MSRSSDEASSAQALPVWLRGAIDPCARGVDAPAAKPALPPVSVQRLVRAIAKGARSVPEIAQAYPCDRTHVTQVLRKYDVSKFVVACKVSRRACVFSLTEAGVQLAKQI